MFYKKNFLLFRDKKKTMSFATANLLQPVGINQTDIDYANLGCAPQSVKV